MSEIKTLKNRIVIWQYRFKKAHCRLKSWLIDKVQDDMLWHYIFGIWAGLVALLADPEWFSVILATSIVAIGKECWDYLDYGLFSWKDVLFTYVGGFTILIYHFVS